MIAMRSQTESGTSLSGIESRMRSAMERDKQTEAEVGMP